jgi:hypothetical protein
MNNTFSHTYARYLAALAPAQKCACQAYPLGRCPKCSSRPSVEKETPIDFLVQLELPLSTTTSNIYED